MRFVPLFCLIALVSIDSSAAVCEVMRDGQVDVVMCDRRGVPPGYDVPLPRPYDGGVGVHSSTVKRHTAKVVSKPASKVLGDDDGSGPFGDICCALSPVRIGLKPVGVAIGDDGAGPFDGIFG